MLLIAGLGNPGEKYKKTRHNVGFMFVDYVLSEVSPSPSWKFDAYTKAEITKTNSMRLHAILAKPQTFMNRSGESIRSIAKNNSLSPTDILVAHDDLDLELGNFKIQLGVGPKKHNGLSSIQDHLHTPDFWRIRIGVDNRNGDRSLSGEEYVLQNFTNEELILLNNIFKEIYPKLLTVLL